MFEKILKRYNFNDNVFMMMKKYIVSFILYKYFIREKIFVKLKIWDGEFCIWGSLKIILGKECFCIF